MPSRMDPTSAHRQPCTNTGDDSGYHNLDLQSAANKTSNVTPSRLRSRSGVGRHRGDNERPLASPNVLGSPPSICAKSTDSPSYYGDISVAPPPASGRARTPRRRLKEFSAHGSTDPLGLPMTRRYRCTDWINNGIARQAIGGKPTANSRMGSRCYARGNDEKVHHAEPRNMPSVSFGTGSDTEAEYGLLKGGRLWRDCGFGRFTDLRRSAKEGFGQEISEACEPVSNHCLSRTRKHTANS